MHERNGARALRNASIPEAAQGARALTPAGRFFVLLYLSAHGWGSIMPRMAKILLVDDEKIVLETLGVLLRSEQHQVTALSEGSDAYELLWSKQPYDMLMTDIRMSPIDGLQLIKVARELSPQMPIVVVSAYLDATTIKTIKQMGCADYIKKPFTVQEVLRVVRGVLEKKAEPEAKDAQAKPPADAQAGAAASSAAPKKIK